jgi:hypothetical protein
MPYCSALFRFVDVRFLIKFFRIFELIVSVIDLGPGLNIQDSTIISFEILHLE